MKIIRILCMILLALALMLYNACRSGRPVPASGEIKKMNNKYKIISLFSLCFSVLANAQNEDTISTKNLKTVIVQGYRFPINEVKQLKEVHQTYITSGRKHEVIVVQDLPANLAEKTGRQVFAKIPGAFVYDMDGSGNQVNVSTRGLDPHRSWEYNVRQNGVMTNSDIYAYPASGVWSSDGRSIVASFGIRI